MSSTTNGIENTDYEWLLSRSKTAYEFLSLDRSNSITNSIIRKSYIRKALELHPDKNQSLNAEEEFREAAVSYNILTNPDLRLRYDEFLEKQASLLIEKRQRTSQHQQLRDDLLTAENKFRMGYDKDVDRNRKIEILRKQYSKMKKDKVKSILNTYTKTSQSSLLSRKDDRFPFPSEVRLKWKNKPALESSITSDVLTELMQVFGDIDHVQISRNNKSSDDYHYATIFYKSHLSCIVAELHNYSRSSSIWNEVGLTRLSKLLRSAKIIKYSESLLDNGDANSNNLSFEKYLGLSLLKLRKTVHDEKHRKP